MILFDLTLSNTFLQQIIEPFKQLPDFPFFYYYYYYYQGSIELLRKVKEKMGSFLL